MKTGIVIIHYNDIESLKHLVENVENYHVISKIVIVDNNSRKDVKKSLRLITGKKIIHTIQDAEPIGPKKLTDVMVIAPCSGNTMAKLALDIIDTPVTMAAKSHLRNDRPLVIAPSTNNGLSGNAENIGKLLNRKNYYFVPFRKDNPITKPRSIVFEEEYLIKTIEYALEGTQISPILLWFV